MGKDIELMITIPEEKYNYVKKQVAEGIDNPLKVYIANGTPLPKGHGDLVTKEQMVELVEFYQINPQHFDFVNLIDEIKDEKPLIEADKAEEPVEEMDER